MIINSFPKIVKKVLASLPKKDYPVLNTRLFVECWLSYAMDKSLTSIRDLFKRLNNTGFSVDISTFSKASSDRSEQIFQQIYRQLSRLVARKNLSNKYTICPIDSTTISLTSKLLWSLGYHQVKLFSSLNLQTGATEENLIVFGFNHDYKYGKTMMDTLPANGVGVMNNRRFLRQRQASFDIQVVVTINRGVAKPAFVFSGIGKRLYWSNFFTKYSEIRQVFCSTDWK